MAQSQVNPERQPSLSCQRASFVTSTEVPVPTRTDPTPCGLQFTRRLDHELPPVANIIEWRYHHVGISTTVVHEDETHLEQLSMHLSGFSTSPYGIEWMRFEDDSPLHELIRTVPNIAFEVDDLDAALDGQDVIYPSGSPSEGVRSAMIVHNGAPVALIWFRKPEPQSQAPGGLGRSTARAHQACPLTGGISFPVLECWESFRLHTPTDGLQSRFETCHRRRTKVKP